MIQQLIYRRAEQGYRTVATSEGLMGKGLARRIEALSTLPPSGGKKRLGAQPVYCRCAVEDGLAVLMTAIDPGGIRGSHMTHAWYVEPEDVAAFAEGGAIALDAFVKEYREQSRMDELPGYAPDGLPQEDSFALGCEAAAALFGGREELLAKFLTAAVRCGTPTAGRGFLGVCALVDADEGALTAQAYRLMEAALRAYPVEKVRAVGYRTLWNRAEDNVRYPVFFTTPDLIGSEASVPMNYCLFDLRSGSVRMPRGAELKSDDCAAALAQALLSGDAGRVRALKREADERETRRAEEERVRREAEAKARAEAEARQRAETDKRRKAEEARRLYEEEQQRKAEEARRLYEEQQQRKAAEEEARRRQAEEARRLYEQEQQRKAEEHARKEAEQRRIHEEEQRNRDEAARAREEDLARQKRVHENYLRQKAEAERQEQLDRDAEKQRAAIRSLGEQRSLAEGVRRSAQPEAVRPARKPAARQAAAPSNTDVLNRFLKDLHLHVKDADIPAHELDRMVGEHVNAVARGNGNTDWAFLNYAEQLLQAIASTLRDRRDSLNPKVYVLLAKCAYSIADCAMGLMFRNPADRRTRACANALKTIDKQVERADSPANAHVSQQRRDKWYVYISVLNYEDEPSRMRSCVNVIRSIRDNNVNSALEQMRRTLDECAGDMIEVCAEKPPRSSDRGELFKRAVLATVYAQMKFNGYGQAVWDQQIVRGRRLTRTLQWIGLLEQFDRDVDSLIDEITR